MKGAKSIWVVVIFLAGVANAGLTNVTIVPSEPTIYDSISIVTQGVEGTGPVRVTPVWAVAGNDVVLDLSIEPGFLQVITPWSYTAHIGVLPAGMYSLDVNAIYSPTFTQTVSTSFEVVPEPSGFLLLMAGIPLLRGKNKRS